MTSRDDDDDDDELAVIGLVGVGYKGSDRLSLFSGATIRSYIIVTSLPSCIGNTRKIRIGPTLDHEFFFA